jgi:D-ribose pyranose/furanose isomerase RbsD
LSELQGIDKAKYIIDKINKNISKEDLSKELGYGSIRSLDSFVRKFGFKWDSVIKNYYMPISKEELINLSLKLSNNNTLDILSDLYKSVSVEDVVNKYKFKNIHEFGKFMQENDYLWNSLSKLYIHKSLINDFKIENDIKKSEENTITLQIQEYETLKYLTKNIEKIKKILENK